MKSVNEFIAMVFKESGTPNERGNEVRRAFLPTGRYRIDFADDFKSEGWEQFDTSQDAAYFGVWMNKRLQQTLTYAEGDWTLVICPDWDHYLSEVRSAIEFYEEGFVAKAIDVHHGRYVSTTTYKQDRMKFLEPEPQCQN